MRGSRPKKRSSKISASPKKVVKFLASPEIKFYHYSTAGRHKTSTQAVNAEVTAKENKLTVNELQQVNR
jgi:hypothetical protein